MRFIRLSAIKATADVVSGILNWVCPECGGRMGASGENSGARVNVRRTGVMFGSGFSQLDIDVEWGFDGCYCCVLPLVSIARRNAEVILSNCCPAYASFEHN
jgi:hypothetical protein